MGKCDLVMVSTELLEPQLWSPSIAGEPPVLLHPLPDLLLLLYSSSSSSSPPPPTPPPPASSLTPLYPVAPPPPLSTAQPAAGVQQPVMAAPWSRPEPPKSSATNISATKKFCHQKAVPPTRDQIPPKVTSTLHHQGPVPPKSCATKNGQAATSDNCPSP